MSPFAILGLLLALSLAGNAWLGSSYLEARDERTEAIGQRDQARGAANECSAGTEALQEQSRLRSRASAADLDKARAGALQHQQAAQQILATPAAVPGDECQSARIRVDAWLQGRAKR